MQMIGRELNMRLAESNSKRTDCRGENPVVSDALWAGFQYAAIVYSGKTVAFTTMAHTLKSGIVLV